MRRLIQFSALLLVIAVVLSSVSVSAKPQNDSGMVVITAKGKKYHNPGCRTVKKTHKILTIEEARSKGYTPCKVCGAE